MRGSKSVSRSARLFLSVARRLPARRLELLDFLRLGEDSEELLGGIFFTEDREMLVM